MDKETLQKEIQDKFSVASLENYKLVRESYFLVLHSKYDIIRDEIFTCITFRCFQAAITLTNHLLELLLKDCLIFKECGFTKVDSPQKFETYGIALEKFDKLVLFQTIEDAKAADIINEDEQTKLHEFRKKFRNAYGHAQKTKIFEGQDPVNFGIGKLTDNEPLQMGTVPASSFFIGHAYMQASMASEDAIPYFLYVDGILCREEIKRHPEIIEHPDVYKRKFNF